MPLANWEASHAGRGEPSASCALEVCPESSRIKGPHVCQCVLILYLYLLPREVSSVPQLQTPADDRREARCTPRCSLCPPR